MTEMLAEKKCTPCRGGIPPPLTRDEAQRFQAQAPNWELDNDAHHIRLATSVERAPLLASPALLQARHCWRGQFLMSPGDQFRMSLDKGRAWGTAW